MAPAPLRTDPWGSRTAFLLQVDNAYWLWTFQGRLLQKNNKDRFCQLLWRPRPPTLLSQDQIKVCSPAGGGGREGPWEGMPEQEPPRRRAVEGSHRSFRSRRPISTPPGRGRELGRGCAHVPTGLNVAWGALQWVRV